MQWIYAVESHLLGFIERTGGRADEKADQAGLESQKDELIEIERYYTRAATKAARIVYFWGMVVGAAVSAALGVGLALALWYGPASSTIRRRSRRRPSSSASSWARWAPSSAC